MGTDAIEHQQHLARYSDWPRRLQDYLAAADCRRFRYGEFDCCLFVADAVLAMTGIDLAAEFRGRYCSRREAMELLQTNAAAPSVPAAARRVADRFGLPTVPVLRAQRGDMLLVRRPRDYSLGLLYLDGCRAVVPARGGLRRIPLTACAAAWRI